MTKSSYLKVPKVPKVPIEPTETISIFHAEDIYENPDQDKFFLLCRALIKNQKGFDDYVVEDFELHSDDFNTLYDFKSLVNKSFEPIDITEGLPNG